MESGFAHETLTRILRRILNTFEVNLLSDVLMDNHYRSLIADVRHLVIAVAYDHRNPVRAAIAGSPESFGRSSARWWKYGEIPKVPLCTRPDFPFGMSRDRFRDLLLEFQENRAAQDVFEAFARNGIPLSSVRGQRLMEQLLEEAELDPLNCGINAAPRMT